MALQTVYFKEHEGVVHNSIGQLSTASSGWWGSFVSQSVEGDSYGQLKTFSFEQPSKGEQLTVTKQAGRTAEEGESKNSRDGQKKAAAISVQPSLPEYGTRFELGFSQAMYPYGNQCCGIFSAYGPQGRIMLPLSIATDDGPIYVNAKQYNGIIRRRKSRAKAVMQNRLTRVRKPYMHESRHLHAMRRPRGCGGRFLNTQISNNNNKNGTEASKLAEKLSRSGSQSSEVMQTDSSKETNGSSNLSGSEVCSTYPRGDLSRFQINHLGPSLLSLSDMMVDNGHGVVMPSKWVGAADNCFNFRI